VAKITRPRLPAFQVGDIVMIKSGGPDMTIEAVLPYDHKVHPAVGYFCVWIDKEQQVQRAEFLEETLLKQP
jgi:uncharacterized protein YodC (DUF2158 family)